MKKEIRKSILFIFIGLCIATVLFSSIKLRNPYIFPGAEQRLFLFTTIFGTLSLVLYFQNILNFLKIGFLNAVFKKIPKKLRKEKKGKKIKLKEKIKKPILQELIKLFSLYIKSLISYSKKNPLKFFLIVVAIFLYIYFLFWLYPKLTFDEFAFFLLLLYIPFSLKLKLDERYPVAFAIFLLILSAITLAQGFEERANRIAIYAYYFLVIGVILMLAEYLREPKNNSSIALL